MRARNAGPKGFTLVEMMVALTIMLFVIIALVSLIITTQSTHLTEGRKLDMNQGARLIEQLLYDNFRSSASVLSLANTPTMLQSAVVPFNGVFPLNNADYPDGVILAAGDPQALTRLTGDFLPGDHSEVNILTVNLPDNTGVAWQVDDFGLVMRPDGYYVFRVADPPPAPGDTKLTVRTTPAYYSGLLNTANYNDPCDDQFGSFGNNGPYTSGSPVVRLEFFNIFLVRTEADGTRTLTLTTDCENVGDVFANPITDRRALPVMPNVEDIQIDYLTHDAPPLAWAGGEGARSDPCPAGNESSGNCQSFYSQFFTRNIATARIYVLLRTEEERSKHQGSGIVYAKPAMGDRPAVTLPTGRFHYVYMQYEVLIRNFSNVY
ncbi:MAG: prepilin-type N-terminal cleavage/methylation domain-containing protein [Candidatus Aminicenantes bacterium]|nr:prepilin-type N-terminal cleavage/methylation domain-containing protein [Candidatus Aminicenantes bacterium]